MIKRNLILLLLPLVLFSCSSGKKALQRGDYYEAITKAVERLKSNPTNEKALKVLKDGYPTAIDWSQEEIDLALTSNQSFKWEHTILIMNKVNRMNDLIRSTPAAREIISDPKSYSTELNMAHEKAAEDRYQAGLEFLAEETRESARTAYSHFNKAGNWIPGYKDIDEKMAIAKEWATVNVVIEAVTVRTKKYQLSSEFFYNQVFEYVNNKFPSSGFVNFFSPQQAENFQLNPDFVVRMEFYDFSVGNLVRNEKEESLSKRVRIPVTDSTFVSKTYHAKLKTYTDEVISGGRLNYRIVDFQNNNLLRDNLIPGSFTWVNQYAIFAGDEEALSDEQYALTQQRAIPLPAHQDLFIEFTRPIYEQLTDELYSFFRRYR
ncbi:hypothetical protein SLH46_12770 [Draconibacterium sp. IB214405]|uniref:hypothetical protein n=1 Tax=Draconibacterium sp. IB214405 TaxID=3097352 RepID=UPI002A1703B2|nr:hypothetical protein [Draconibacterium sp. IB214405]MDX8340066.1 hypothetical protein [Draconibacterium sp. IB214405]